MIIRAVRLWGRVLWGVESVAVLQNAPGGSSEFVGRRDGRFVSRHTGDRSGQPRAETEFGPPVWAHHDHFRRLHKQQPQIAAAAFGDPAENGATAGAELPGHQAKPWRETSRARTRCRA